MKAANSQARFARVFYENIAEGKETFLNRILFDLVLSLSPEGEIFILPHLFNRRINEAKAFF